MDAQVRAESWPIRGEFRIARGARARAEVLVLELRDGTLVGRAECVPYARYGESIDSVRADIDAACAALGPEYESNVMGRMAPGAARNAVDCALWDLRAKREETPVWGLAGMEGPPEAMATMRTVSVGDVEQMSSAARRLEGAPMIKVKVDGGRDLERIASIHEAAPRAALVVDANEAWRPDQLRAWLPRLPELGVKLLEQPLAAGNDEDLGELEHAVPICADESFHDRESFDALGHRYDAVNIKLDKAGGLTEALACKREARARGLRVMVGCMVCTSLAIEPALLLAQGADYIDLDGPLLLEHDRGGALHDREFGLLRPSSAVWGAG